MRRLGWLSSSTAVAILAVGGVVAVLFAFGGRMFNPGPLNADSHDDRELGGVTSHAELSGNCSACHAPPWSRETMASRCLDCHEDIRRQIDSDRSLHGKMSNGTNCRECHTEHKGAHASITDMAKFDHDYAAFALTGKHEAVDCKSCHTNNVRKGTPQDCASCHIEPDVHKGRLGTACASCHTTATWQNSKIALKNFDHNLTAFKLTGKHTAVDCKSCHVNEVFKGTPQTCVGCHAEPTVHKGRFGAGCAKCHSTDTWKVAPAQLAGQFDHNLTAFKLTGKHTTVDCKKCHVNEVFKGTAQTCVGCHAEPVTHKGRFGTACAQCHSTSTWQGATFQHTMFSINHGRRNNTCATCHTDATNYKTYTCYNCHEHSVAKTERQHMRRKITDIDNCMRCHARGRKRERERAESPDSSLNIESLFALDTHPSLPASDRSCPECGNRSRSVEILLGALRECPSRSSPSGASCPSGSASGCPYSTTR